MDAENTPSRRPQIIGGIVGGALGLMAVLLLLYCIYYAIQKRRLRRPANLHKERCPSSVYSPQASPPPAYQVSPLAIDSSATPAVASPAVYLAHPTKSEARPPHVRLPHVRLPVQAKRPLPAAPRTAPEPPPTRPYVNNSVHHETPYINLHGAQYRPEILRPAMDPFE